MKPFIAFNKKDGIENLAVYSNYTNNHILPIQHITHWEQLLSVYIQEISQAWFLQKLFFSSSSVIEWRNLDTSIPNAVNIKPFKQEVLKFAGAVEAVSLIINTLKASNYWLAFSPAINLRKDSKMQLKSDSHLPKRKMFYLFYCFLFHLKSSFRFVLTFWSFRKNSLIRKIRLTVKFMTSQPG